MLASIAIAFADAGSVCAQTGQRPGLRIVVIRGEDAVNVIQQKSAVAPVIEVRDRNNLPVPGAVVTFTLQGGKAAAFAGGAPTFTITTNAAGQAAAAALTPMTAGPVNISVLAAFQQQVATAAITQINVMTAAEAATIAGGTSGAGAGTGTGAGAGTGAGTGGGAAAGGGLSGTTIGIVSGVAAAGVAGAVAVTSSSGRPPVIRAPFPCPSHLNLGRA